jgi:hypothetical protein
MSMIQMIRSEVEHRIREMTLARSFGKCCTRKEFLERYPELFSRRVCCLKGLPERWELEYFQRHFFKGYDQAVLNKCVKNHR